MDFLAMLQGGGAGIATACIVLYIRQAQDRKDRENCESRCNKRLEAGDGKFDKIMDGISQLSIQVARIEGKNEGQNEIADKIVEAMKPFEQIAKTQQIILENYTKK